MCNLVDRFKKIKTYKSSPMYQPDIDEENGNVDGENIVNVEKPLCEGDAQGAEFPEKEIFFDNDSFVEDFFCKYEHYKDDKMVAIKNHLGNIVGDIAYIMESGNQNEQWAIDFLDALNELSHKF